VYSEEIVSDDIPQEERKGAASDLQQEEHVTHLLLVRGAGDPEPGIDEVVVVVSAVELVCLHVKLGQTVPWTVHDVEELWKGKHEVEHLRYKEQKHGLGEVS
jgi:hypothetical protein